MSGKMVVQFMPDGTVAHTRSKDFDLAEALGGTKKIERMTDIKFHEGVQKFYIEFLRGKTDHNTSLAGFVLVRVVGSEDIEIEKANFLNAAIIENGGVGDLAFFDTYEGAVACEIEVVNLLRKQGWTF